MTTINQPSTAPEDRPSKPTVFFTALALAALMVSAVGGGAAFMIYHEFTAMPDPSQTSAAHAQTTRLAKFPVASSRETNTDGQADTVPMNRPVAAESSDRSDYRYAANTVLSPAAARRVIAAWTSNPVLPSVPAPLAKPDTEEVADAGNRPPLTDSGSHYIVNQQTGQVVGVDGSAGAAAEARRVAAMPVAAAIPVAVAVQTPSPEIRVASAVQVRAAIPVISGESDVDGAQSPMMVTGTQYVPIRRALPVASTHPFNASGYLASEDDAAAPRDQVVTATSRATSPRREFHLPGFGN